MLYFYYWLCNIPNSRFYCHVYRVESNPNYFDNAEHVRDICNMLLLKTNNRIGTQSSLLTCHVTLNVFQNLSIVNGNLAGLTSI